MAIEVLALAGGVGGAKLALGLARILPPDKLAIVVNTGDDESFYGLHVSPDLDTVMYTLAGLSNTDTGWGLAGDTFQALDMLGRYGVDTWFNLGDRDLATHIHRTELLRQGATLSEVTAELCSRVGIEHRIAPMSDQPVRTFLTTQSGDLAMQDYFVRQRSEPQVTGVKYVGSEAASPSPVLQSAMEQANLLVLCPSNPYLSVGPILAIPGVREGLESFGGFRVAVSPIVGGSALRGPAAKMMGELGDDASCAGVARPYMGITDAFLIDRQDSGLAPEIEGMGIQAVPASIIMETEADKVALAEIIMDMAANKS